MKQERKKKGKNATKTVIGQTNMKIHKNAYRSANKPYKEDET